MELLIIISSILRRFEFVLESPDKHVSICDSSTFGHSLVNVTPQFDTAEGFLRKPVECIVGIRRRAQA